MGHFNVDKMLSEMSYRQVLEWEKFSQKNPYPEEMIILQMALIASIFANYYIRGKGQPEWKIDDFIPKFKDENEKEVAKDLKQKLFGVALTKGDKKAKEKAKKQLKNEFEYHIGTDGQKYKYAMEEFAKPRKRKPKRLRGK